MTEQLTPKIIGSALRLAIDALKDYRRRHFAIGHNAFVRGQIFTFSERDDQFYQKYTGAIETLQQILNSPSTIQTKRRISIKGLTKAQNEWLNTYEGSTGFEPMYLEDLAAGKMTFDEVAKGNIDWYEMHKNDAFQQITANIPFTS